MSIAEPKELDVEADRLSDRATRPETGGAPALEREEATLMQIVYASAARAGFQLSELPAILTSARRRNAELWLTGMLVYEGTSFLQVLEGAGEVIDALFGRIRTDRRHSRVVLLLREPLASRSFSEWTMGASRVTLRELERAVGEQDGFFQPIDSFSGLSDEKVRRVLELFRSGSFRQRLT